MRTRLPLILAATAATALAAPAAHAASFRTYKISIRGEQTTEWSYQGRTPGNCGGTQQGSGRQHFTFRSAPLKVVVARAGGNGRWGFAAALAMKAEGSRTGHYTQTGCGDTYTAPTKDCGNQTWHINGSAQYGLSAPFKNVKVDSAAGLDSRFSECPWFEGPADSSYLDQVGDGDVGRSNDFGAGLRFGQAILSGKPFAKGKSFELPKRTVKTYRYKGQFGQLKGSTVLRWTLVFKKVR